MGWHSLTWACHPHLHTSFASLSRFCGDIVGSELLLPALISSCAGGLPATHATTHSRAITLSTSDILGMASFPICCSEHPESDAKKCRHSGTGHTMPVPGSYLSTLLLTAVGSAACFFCFLFLSAVLSLQASSDKFCRLDCCCPFRKMSGSYCQITLKVALVCFLLPTLRSSRTVSRFGFPKVLQEPGCSAAECLGMSEARLGASGLVLIACIFRLHRRLWQCSEKGMS